MTPVGRARRKSHQRARQPRRGGSYRRSSANNSLARNNKMLAGRIEENRWIADLILRASASRLKGPDYYDVLSDGEVVGCIHLRPIAPPPGRPWMWTLAYGHTNATEPQHTGSRRHSKPP